MQPKNSKGARGADSQPLHSTAQLEEELSGLPFEELKRMAERAQQEMAERKKYAEVIRKAEMYKNSPGTS